MSSETKTMIKKPLAERLKSSVEAAVNLLRSPKVLMDSIKQKWVLLLLFIVAALAVQFVAIPVTHVVLEKVYPPIKEKKLFGLYEKTKVDSRLETRKAQFQVAWWVGFTGAASIIFIFFAPQLRRIVLRANRGGMAGNSIGANQRYKVLEEIGRGAMGVVYLGYDATLQRDVAIKELPSTLLIDAGRRARFRREALTLAKFSHKGIVNIFDLIEEQEKMMLVMEFVDGGSLIDSLPQQEPLSVEDACKNILDISEALAYIHSQGIVHRDIKPDNILIDSNKGLKISDFGLAKLCQETSLTVDGSVLGSPLYMSPEQARGKDVDLRSDIYALGAIFYRLVTGESPFDGDIQEVIVKQISVEPEPPRKKVGTIPANVNELIMAMLSKDPEGRPQNCDTVSTTIKAFNNLT